MAHSVVGPEALRMCVGRHIRQYRQSKRWSLRDLARVTGLSYQYLSNVENGVCGLTVDNLEVLSKALGIPVSAFVANEDAVLETVPAAV